MAARGLLALSALLFGQFVVALAQQPSGAAAIPATAPSASSVSGVPSGATSDERYRIGPGDLLDIRVFKRAELSRDSVRVDARGMIRMPLIKNEIQAACRTESELENEIEKGYQKYLLEPQVSVFVKEFQSQPVAVLGAVKTPGRFLLQRRLRLLDLLSFVGGASDQAGRSIQVVHANQPSICETPAQENAEVRTATGLVFYQLSETLQGSPQANPYVQPGDIITIPPAEQVLIVGNVLKPSAIPLKEPITLTRAIALAGGTLPDTKSERIRIVRQTQGSTATTDIYANLKEINKRQAEDIVLQPNDIIEVPKASGGAKILKDMLRTLVPTIANLPVRVIP